MIGIGLVKDSDAVFFQYVGDDQKKALMQENGKPVTRLVNVFFDGVSIAENIYKDAGFDGSKLNVFLKTQGGISVMLTSGITTMWSQCIVTALMGMYNEHALNSLVNVDSYKGKSSKGAVFAAIRNNGRKMTSQAMYDDLAEARADRNKAEVTRIMRDAISLLSVAFNEDTAAIDTETQIVSEEVSEEF